MSKYKLLFIFNPLAGTSQIKGKLIDVLNLMTQKGYEITIYPTQGTQDVIDIVTETAAEYERVVCSGGDGTFDAVVNGMMKSSKIVPIGYIPSGSTNDFATSLKLPKNIIKAAEISLSDKRFFCDVGRFNEDIFTYVVAFGMFTKASYETSRELKNALGQVAYFLKGVQSIVDIQSYNMTVICNNQSIEGDFIYGMVTNSFSIGGFTGMTGKDVKLDDGLFEVTLIRTPRTAGELNEIITTLLGQTSNSKMIESFKASEIRFISNTMCAWTKDGEYGGIHQEISIKNIARAIEIIC